MIVLMSDKQWYKNKKKLVAPKDYLIIDGTEDDDAKLSAFTNVVTIDGFNPPPKLVKLSGKGLDDIIDYESIEKLEDNYFNGMRLQNAIMSTINGLIQDDVNIFIIFRNKAFKVYKKRILKTFKKMFDVDFKFICIFSGDVGDIKKELRSELSSEDRRELQRLLNKNEERAKKEYKKHGKKKYRK